MAIVRRRPALAWAVLVLTLGLTVATVAAWSVARPPLDTVQLYVLVDVLDGAVYGAAAWVVLRRASHAAGWIFVAAGVGGAVSGFSRTWGLLAAGVPGLWTHRLLTDAWSWAWIPGLFGLLILLPWLLPPRRPTAGVRAVLACGVAFIGIVTVVVATDPWTARAGGAVPQGLRRAVFGWSEPVLVLLGLAAAAGVFLRRHRAPATERGGLGWLAWATVLLSLAFLPLAVAPAASGGAPPLLMLASQALFPAAVFAVVLRLRLWRVDIAVRRTMLWLLMTTLVVAGYAGSVALVGATGAPTPQILATAAVAIAFSPVRQWAQRRVDRLVYGERTADLIRTVSDGLHGAAEPGRQLRDVAEGIAASMRLVGCVVTVDGAAVGVLVTGLAGEPMSVPLTRDGRAIGELVAWPPAGERLDGRSAATLAGLAPVVAALVDLTRLDRELTRSRARVAQARDSERRKLRRDLHDGLGPALSGMGFALAGARNLLRADLDRPAVAAADRLLAGLGDEAARYAGQVRDLARDLVPPVLDTDGLLPALQELSHRYAAAGLTVRVEAEAVPLPEDAVVAIYAVVTEAVRNVHRHSGADACTVAVHRQTECVEVSVLDQGNGFGTRARAGVGMQSMRERAEGLGGVLTVDGRAGGTAVRLTIPVRRP
ncbi:sensor histidine kinase [Dactylosporangium sp. CA-152071]|uniref:sensor histidine kinase n=1 Tax=Dactylosporangium sp. CA-152071 TaxID=3239933 RepID=UPI003D8A902E